MREIKFRAWDDEEKKMFYDVGVHPWEVIIFEDTKGKMIVPQEIGSIGIDREELSLEQFTGLKDKNGKEIFEGDIVVGRGYSSKPQEVKWTRDGFYLPELIHYGDGRVSTDFYIKYEVIGNIHENSELLEEK